MKPFRKLGLATTTDGTVLSLFEHDGAYVMMVNGVELMSTRRHQSEDALADLACAPLRERPGARVLIGGLGLGFTLKAALGILAPDASVVVAEIAAAVIDWNRNPDWPLACEALLDPRVDVRRADVAEVISANPAAFDAIMLDVDNGAEPLTTSGNARLYRPDGIAAAVAALRPGGRVVYWSADDDRSFAGAMQRAGLAVTTTRVPSHATSRATHTLLVGTLRPSPRARA